MLHPTYLNEITKKKHISSLNSSSNATIRATHRTALLGSSNYQLKVLLPWSLLTGAIAILTSIVENKLCTLQEINLSYLRKRKIIFKYAIFWGYVSSLEGTPWKFNSSPLKNDGKGRRSFPFGFRSLFGGELLNFRGVNIFLCLGWNESYKRFRRFRCF